MERLIDFLSGALTLAYVLAGVYFLRFWKKTHDRLFSYFAIAFCLFALNQITSFESATGEATGFPYVLRVAGFLIILAAIVGKNTGRGK